jgi:hypothetical protein
MIVVFKPALPRWPGCPRRQRGLQQQLKAVADI